VKASGHGAVQAGRLRQKRRQNHQLKCLHLRLLDQWHNDAVAEGAETLEVPSGTLKWNFTPSHGVVDANRDQTGRPRTRVANRKTKTKLHAANQ
jgi:hypothetical protein